MMNNRIYRHTSIKMSRPQLSDMLYWCVMCDVIITCTHSLGMKFTRKQNVYNTAEFALGFKDEASIERFETETGFDLRLPPKILLND